MIKIMENNLENKARFFAQYWGQKIVEDNFWMPNEFRTIGYKHQLFENADSHIGGIRDKHLSVKPISLMSSEDAIEICEIHFIQQGIDFKMENLVNIKIEASPIPSKCNSVCIEVAYKHSWGTELERIFIDSNRKTNSAIVDKIRELGFAFSFNILSVEKQIEYGWIKLKQK